MHRASSKRNEERVRVCESASAGLSCKRPVPLLGDGACVRRLQRSHRLHKFKLWSNFTDDPFARVVFVVHRATLWPPRRVPGRV